MNKKDLCVLVITAFLGISNVSYAQTATSEESSSINVPEQKEQISDDILSEDKKVKGNKETFEKAQSAYENKDFQNAIVLSTIYINSKPKKYEAYKLRGDAFYALHQFELAQKDYQNAVNLKSADDKLMTSTKYVSAVILGADKNEQLQNTELGNLYGRLMYAQKALNDPKYEESYANAVKYNSHIYLPQPKKSDINKINCPQKYGKVINPQGIDSVIYGAIDDIEKENYHNAIFKVQEITSKYPKYYWGHYLAGVVLAGLDKTDDAIKSFEQALKYNPYDFESQASLGQIYFDRAETRFSQSDAKKSINYFKQALKGNPKNNTYHFYIGMNELQMGNTNLAISHFNEALKINPNDYNSVYYKNIAQFINGNYDRVVDGTTKLLYKHVSNYNSVLYLRALANYENKSYEKAIADLDTIQSNVEDIYNSDVKVISDKEKTLESYTYYLRDKIARELGTGDRANLAQAYKNPIVAKLAKAEEAMEPYEKFMKDTSVSLEDYEKFNDFYSTGLPKLLAENIEITSKDIDNQYDYIRTTFKDLGISFIYNNPGYKITTIENYPYKKYASKLAKTDIDTISAKMPEDTKKEAAKNIAPELKPVTSGMEKLGNITQPSVAQMLAANSLVGKTISDVKTQTQTLQKPVTREEEIIELPTKPKFLPQTPAAERINSSANVASGDAYALTGKPSLLNDTNKGSIKTILNEEKELQKPIIPENRSMAQGVKVIANEIKETPDIVVKNAVTVPIAGSQVAKQPENNLKEIAQNANGYKLTANEIKETPDIVVKNAVAVPITSNQTVKQVENNIKEVAQNANSYKLTANEVKETPDIKIKYEKPVDRSGLPSITKQSQYNIETTSETLNKVNEDISKEIEKTTSNIESQAKQAEQQIQKTGQTAKEQLEQQAAKIKQPAAQKVEQIKQTVEKETKEVKQETNKTAEKIKEQTKNTTGVIKEKYANINPEDFGVQTRNMPIITPEDDIVELNTNSLLDDMGLDSDFMEKVKQNNTNAQNELSVFNNNFKKASAKIKSPLTEPVVLDEDEIIPASSSYKKESVAVPVVVVSEIETPKETIKTEEKNPAPVQDKTLAKSIEEINSLAAKENTALVPAYLLEERPVVTNEDIDKKAAEELNRIVPKVAPKIEEAAETVQEIVEKPAVIYDENAPLTKEKLEAEKARLQQEIEQQREQLKLAKEKAKNEAKAKKILEKEKAKAQKAQKKWEKNIEKTMAKNQEKAQKSEKQAADELAKLQKEREKLVSTAKTEKDQAEQEILKIKQQTEKFKSQMEKDAQKAQLKAERKQAQKEAKARKRAAKAQKN